MSAPRVTVRHGLGPGARPNQRIPGWHVRAGVKLHVFFEYESAARRTAEKLKLDPDYYITAEDFEP